ncbi:MAG: membrane protein insertase YidC [Gammaproteobacteria bacterium RIFCSPHIGHO2_12_FULL_45_9]|nr:MAG: membrane protein insertase YidC [Gammaproteobacteria bacterium RIFCSPHIGHO2_12_FULL_45_9]
MNIRRLMAYGLVAVSAALLWRAWTFEHPNLLNAAEPLTMAAESKQDFVPETPSGTAASDTSAAVAHTTTAVRPLTVGDTKTFITLKTDVLTLLINPVGGNIVSAELNRYPAALGAAHATQLFSPLPTQWYVAESGLTDVSKAPLVFHSTATVYELHPGIPMLTVSLTAQASNGLVLTKTYQLRRGDYTVHLNYTVRNQGKAPWKGSLYTQLERRDPPKAGEGSFYSRTYVGASYSEAKTPYKKLPFAEMNKVDLSETNLGGWVAMQQQYFLSAWIPASQSVVNHLYSRVLPSEGNLTPVYVVGFTGAPITVGPGQQTEVGATLFVGPAETGLLHVLAPGLDHAVDYGWLWPIAYGIFWVMSQCFRFLGNWGWSIVLTTILIKIFFYSFSAKSFRSMAAMRELQPKIQALRERFADDRSALSKATMELYRKEHVNPMGGCLPMLIQIPVFIALYYVISESVELRQAPFLLWIQDLSVQDPYYVLPILMGLSMLLQQWLTPSTGDPMQRRMMFLMPVIFTAFFFKFPAGLVLYWLVNNCVQSFQQWYVMKTYHEHRAKQLAKRHSKK